MLHELKKEQLDRLRRFDDLKSHINDKDNRIMYISRPDKIKITADQVRKVKQLLDARVPIVAIQNLTAEAGMISCLNSVRYHTDSHHGDNMGVE